MLCALFIYGIMVGHYKYPPFNLIINFKKYFFTGNTTHQKLLSKFSVCNIQKISFIKNNSHVFIGHAYGSPYKAKLDSFIAPSAENFIIKNSSKLNTLIFTGDVFFVPSTKKWNKLRIISGKNKNIFITPGNHDIHRPDSKDVFNNSEFGKNNYPILTNLDDTNLVLENSYQNNWIVKDITIDFINNADSEVVIIARHNTPIRDLLSLVNNDLGISKDLEFIEEFSQKFIKKKKYYWIIGDTGASKNLPRLSCLKFKNHTFLLNGLGQVQGDSVIVYHDQKFLQYQLEN